MLADPMAMVGISAVHLVVGFQLHSTHTIQIQLHRAHGKSMSVDPF